MSDQLLATLVIGFYGLSIGFFIPLIWIERPIRRRFFDLNNTDISDNEIRKIQLAIQVVAKANAPTAQGLIYLTATVLAFYQAWSNSFSHETLLLAVLSSCWLIYGLLNVGSAKKAAVETNVEGDIQLVRKSLRHEAIFHHKGFTASLIMFLIQIFLVIGF